MATFVWEARAQSGEVRKGDIDAESLDIATTRLRGQNLQVTNIRKKGVFDFDLKSLNSLKLPGQSGVSHRDLKIFTRQFATMIDAGVPLVQSLDILGGQMENEHFKKVLRQVKMSVESGSTLADALGRHPKIFNRLFVNLVAAGETGGVLDTILERLSTYIEKNAALMKRVKGALTYPFIILLVSIAVTLVLLIFVIPMFEKMFSDFGSALPAPTQIVVDISNGTRDHIMPILAVVAVLGAAVGWGARTRKGQEFFDRTILYVPKIGAVVRKLAVAKFTRTLGTMLASGVPILDALDVVAGTAGNLVVERGLKHVRNQISEGKNMAQPLAQIGIFPSMVVQMIAVGEAAGALDTMLTKIADFYDEEVDTEVAGLTTLIEPLVMMFLAVFLGGMVIAMYLPVFSMAGGGMGE